MTDFLVIGETVTFPEGQAIIEAITKLPPIVSDMAGSLTNPISVRFRLTATGQVVVRRMVM